MSRFLYQIRVFFLYRKQIHKFYFSMSRKYTQIPQKANEPQHQMSMYYSMRPTNYCFYLLFYDFTIKSKYWHIFKQWCLNHKNATLFAARLLHVCVHTTPNKWIRKRGSLLYTPLVSVHTHCWGPITFLRSRNHRTYARLSLSLCLFFFFSIARHLTRIYLTILEFLCGLTTWHCLHIMYTIHTHTEWEREGERKGVW